MSLDIDQIALEAAEKIAALHDPDFSGGRIQKKAVIQKEIVNAISLYNNRLQSKLKERVAEIDRIQRDYDNRRL